jgi:CRISPR-associated protein Cas1
MRYLIISNYGTRLGVSGALLTVHENTNLIREIPLSRLRAVCITKNGVSLSSSLIKECAARGIRIFFLDWRGVSIACVSGEYQRATVTIRKNQFKFIDSDAEVRNVVKEIVITKVRNQRATLLYFNKVVDPAIEKRKIIEHAVELIDSNLILLKNQNLMTINDWKNYLFGCEGLCAKLYWNCLKDASLFPSDFRNREGRGSIDITNQCLNYGYAILSSFVWSSIDNAGLELYAGLYHVDRPGKPSLVLDLMEEYRAWVVDRIVIKLRHKLEKMEQIDATIKKQISNEILKTVSNKYSYYNKKIRLDNIIQRQVYKLMAVINGNETNYKGYKFKW